MFDMELRRTWTAIGFRERRPRQRKPKAFRFLFRALAKRAPYSSMSRRFSHWKCDRNRLVLKWIGTAGGNARQFAISLMEVIEAKQAPDAFGQAYLTLSEDLRHVGLYHSTSPQGPLPILLVQQTHVVHRSLQKASHQN